MKNQYLPKSTKLVKYHRINPCKYCGIKTWSRLRICIDCQRENVHVGFGVKSGVGRIINQKVKRNAINGNIQITF